MRSSALALLGVLLIPAVPAGAQSVPAGLATVETRWAPLIDVKDLPVSLDRIKRRLANTTSERKDGKDGLRLQFYVEVHGQAPRIDLFTDFDLQNGPVPFSAPTHREFLELVTPQEFRSPAADLLTPALAIFKWLTRTGQEKGGR